MHDRAETDLPCSFQKPSFVCCVTQLVYQLQGWDLPSAAPLRNASLTAMGLIFLGHCQRIPLSLYLSIFWLRSLLRETIVTVMEVSFLDHHSLQPAVYISYSIFLSPIFDDGNVVTFHDPS